MENAIEIQQIIQQIEKDLGSIDISIEAMTTELDFLKRKQGAVSNSLGFLKELLLYQPEHSLIIPTTITETTNEMAREITKENKKVIQLKNGQTNITFEEEICLNDFGIPADAIISYEKIGEMPLMWDAEQNRFIGIPEKSGDFVGVIHYWLSQADKDAQKPALERQVHYLVNPDPRSLWQEIEPPKNAPYHKANTDFALEKCCNRMVIGASVRGKSHAHKGTFRDDHFAINCFGEQGWILQIVADGAGSAEFSRQGSKIACDTTTDEITQFLESDKLPQFEDLIMKRFTENREDVGKQISDQVYQLTVATAFKAQKAILKFAESEGQPLKNFATTLLFTLTKKFEFGTIVISFSVGDGAIGALTDKEAKLLMEPDGGEYSGQTRFLTMSEIFRAQDITKRYSLRCFTDELITLMLMTDGISDPKFGTDNNLKDTRYWKALWTELEPVVRTEESPEKALLQWMDFYVAGEYDDRTISILF